MSEEDKLKALASQVLTLADLGVSTSEEDIATLPSGGEAFAAGSLIAKWTGGVYYWFMSDKSYAEHNQDEPDNQVAAPDILHKRGEYYHHFYRSYDAGQRAKEALNPDALDDRGRPYKVEGHFVFTAPVSSILNRTAEGLANIQKGFGDEIVFDAGKILTLRKGSSRYPQNRRHMWNFVVLPALVAAGATVMGIENAGYDLSELTAEGAADTFTDETFRTYCGDVEGDYADSVFYKRRDRLWASLGEEDARCHAIKGAKTAAGKPHSLATQSEKLSQCLYLSQARWTKPLWARVVSVPNPSIDEKQPRQIPALTEFFASEEYAQAVAKTELAERGQEQGSTSAESTDHPPLPDVYSGDYNSLVQFLGGLLVDKGLSDTAVDEIPAPIQAIIVKDCALESWELAKQWIGYIREQG